MRVRACQPGDSAAICNIYNHYISNTTITFEETPLSVQAMAERITAYTALYPWLVCEVGDELVGYAYATKWRERSAYRQTAEATVYLKDGCAGKGYGKALYTALLASLEQQGCHVVLGCIALPNEASIGLHESLGFGKVAHFREVGRKFGRWLDVGYWQKIISD